MIRAGVLVTLVLVAVLFGRHRARPCDSQSYDGLKVRFSATLGEESEVGSRSALRAYSRNCLVTEVSEISCSL